jgi:hypothetical protein
MHGRWREGRSFDLVRMTLPGLLRAYATHRAIHLGAVLAPVGAESAVDRAAGAPSRDQPSWAGERV